MDRALAALSGVQPAAGPQFDEEKLNAWRATLAKVAMDKLKAMINIDKYDIYLIAQPNSYHSQIAMISVFYVLSQSENCPQDVKNVIKAFYIIINESTNRVFMPANVAITNHETLKIIYDLLREKRDILNPVLVQLMDYCGSV